MDFKCELCGGAEFSKADNGEFSCICCGCHYKPGQDLKPEPVITASPLGDFEISGGVLKKYNGSDSVVVIPDTVTVIGDEAFKSSPIEIKSVILPDSVTKIGNAAFRFSFIRSIRIPNSVTEIGNHAFDFCTGLTSVTIPDSVKKIGTCAFSFCDNLKTVKINSLKAWCEIEFGESDSSNPLYRAQLYINNELATNIVIPEGVTAIRSHAFSAYKSLTSVSIPSSVTEIGKHAFDECTGLTSVTIPNGVKTIDSWAFLNCSKLKSITIPESVTKIGISAFNGCSSITSVTIPDGVKEIGQAALGQCNNLRSLSLSLQKKTDKPDKPFSIGYLFEKFSDDETEDKYLGPQFFENITVTAGVIDSLPYVPVHTPIQLGANVKTAPDATGIINKSFEFKGRIWSGAEISEYFRKEAGLCTFCGGEFRDAIFGKKCSKCGKRKNY